MLSLSAKSHWRLAIKSVRKALKVTLNDIIQQIRARKYINKVHDDNERSRLFWQIYEKKRNC
jgi:hypothetical protein